MEGNKDENAENAKVEEKAPDQPKEAEKDEAKKEETPAPNPAEVPSFDGFIKTKNDREWADKNCVYIFDKYLLGFKEDEELELTSKIANLHTDLRILFDFDEDPEVGLDLNKSVMDAPKRTVKEFRELIYQYIFEYREWSISTFLAEGMNLAAKAFETNKEDVEKYFLKQKSQDLEAVKTHNIGKILKDIFEIIYLRLINLDNLLPRDDSGIVNEAGEKEYGDILQKWAEEMKLQEINQGNLESIIQLYLKSGSSKYSFASVPVFNDDEGIDPYADLGDVAPGEEPNEKAKEDPNSLDYIESKIKECEEKGEIEKEALYKRIRQYQQLKEFSQNVSQNEGINIMIDKARKQIAELEEKEKEEEEEREGYIEDEAEAEGEDFAQYQSQADDSKISKQGETLEERRDKGLQEIFQFYARSQMMIGRKATFEQIQHEISNLNLGEYMKFCKDFNIPWNKVKIAELFKKIAKNSKELFYEDFKDTLWKLLETRDKDETDKLKRRLREIKRLLKKKNNQKPPSNDLKDVMKDPKQASNSSKNEDSKTPGLSSPKEASSDPKKDQENDSKDTKKEDKPQTISRPKGGDPKNVETLQNIQKEKEGESDEEDNKKKEEKKENDEEINKKMIDAIENQAKFNKSPSDPQDSVSKDPKTPVSSNLSKEDQELQNERDRILEKIDSLKIPTEEFYREEIYTYLYVDHDKSFRTKIKNFSLPFNTREKHQATNNYKYKTKKDLEKIKVEVQKIKKKREQLKKNKEKQKETNYQRNQNIMKRMHEDMMRDKGVYLSPGNPVNYGTLPNSVQGNHPSLNKQRAGYQVPRKFTLESLGRMDYRDFNPQSTQVEEEGEFKPSDVLDSDEEMDEEIEEFYQFKNRQQQNEGYGMGVAKTSVSAHHLHDAGLNESQGRQMGVKRNAAIGSQKNVNHSVIHNQKIKNIGGRLGKSYLPPQKRANALNKKSRYQPYKVTPAKGRGVSVGHSSDNNKVKRRAAGLYGAKSHKSVHNSVSDYASGQKKNAKLRLANNKSLVRAHKYDARSKQNQEQKLKNILKMQSKKRPLRML